MSDDQTDPAAGTPDTGTEQVNQPADTTGSTAADTGAQEATPPVQNDPSSSTSDTRSETDDQLLQRAVAPGAEKHPAVGQRPAANGQVTTDPFAQLTPEQQKMLRDPAQLQRLANLDKLAGRQAQEVGSLRQRVQSYEGLPPADQLRSIIEQQRQAAQVAQLKPWARQNPDSPKTLERINNARKYRDLVEAERQPDGSLTPEASARLSQLAGKWRVGKEDVDLLNQFDDHKNEIQERLATDFEGLYAEYFDRHFESKFAQKQAEQQAQVGATQFLQSHQEVLTQQPDAALWAMNNPNRREVALRVAQLEVENQKLRQSQVQNSEVVHTAKARDAVTKTRATQKRDPATNAGTMDNVLQRSTQEKWPKERLLQELMKARENDG